MERDRVDELNQEFIFDATDAITGAYSAHLLTHTVVMQCTHSVVICVFVWRRKLP